MNFTNRGVYLYLFSNCIPVRGNRKSVICDLQSGAVVGIPNDLFEILKLPRISYHSLLKRYGKNNEGIISEYFSFVLKNKLGFLGTSEEKNLFPELNKEFNWPATITNAIFEFRSNIQVTASTVLQLESLGCKDVQLIFYETISLNKICRVLDLFEDSKFKSIELYLKHSPEVTESFLEELSMKYMRLTDLVIHGCQQNKIRELTLLKVTMTTKIFKDFKHCGRVDPGNFHANLPKVFEAMNFNSCLNGKISIDPDGEIKNCPAMIRSFGRIQDKVLIEAIAHNDFKKNWKTTKDSIKVCKDCEYRYVCQDCRAFLDNPEDPLSKPLKCGYNPYQGVWSDWSTNPLKKTATDFYQLNKLQ